MIAKRPSIFIYCFQPEIEMLKEICAGIEEEGIFFEFFQYEEKGAELLAYEAAKQGMLGFGIGISRKRIAFSFRGLKKGEVIEIYEYPNKEQCRKVGSNSARAVKRMPLRM